LIRPQWLHKDVGLAIELMEWYFCLGKAIHKRDRLADLLLWCSSILIFIVLSITWMNRDRPTWPDGCCALSDGLMPQYGCAKSIRCLRCGRNMFDVQSP